LETLVGQPLRAVEFSDDRLGGVLHRLSKDAAWEAIEKELWAATVAVYELEVSGIRLDSTTSSGYHHVNEEGVMQFGHSKDHRPDLPQLKLMAAAAEPSGHVVACDLQPGQSADDPLYTPLIQLVRGVLGRTGLVYAGDCKMAALATRGEIAAHQDYYVLPLPLTGETAAEFATWGDAVVEGEQGVTLLWDGDRLLGGGYECVRTLSAPVNGQTVRWSERGQIVRAVTLAQRHQTTLDRHVAAAAAELGALTPAPGRGKRQCHDHAALEAAIANVLARHGVRELLTVHWERHETLETHYVGRGRGGPQRPTRTAVSVRSLITRGERNPTAIAARQSRLGWRVQVTNAPADRLSLPQAVRHYRGGWSLERDCHQLKDLPLGLSPLFVWKDDQLTGLTRLLTLALRLLTLLETQVRRGLEQAQASLTGWYEGAPPPEHGASHGQAYLESLCTRPPDLDSGGDGHCSLLVSDASLCAARTTAAIPALASFPLFSTGLQFVISLVDLRESRVMRRCRSFSLPSTRRKE
jgi:transposase